MDYSHKKVAAKLVARLVGQLAESGPETCRSGPETSCVLPCVVSCVPYGTFVFVRLHIAFDVLSGPPVSVSKLSLAPAAASSFQHERAMACARTPSDAADLKQLGRTLHHALKLTFSTGQSLLFDPYHMHPCCFQPCRCKLTPVGQSTSCGQGCRPPSAPSCLEWMQLIGWPPSRCIFIQCA